MEKDADPIACAPDIVKSAKPSSASQRSPMGSHSSTAIIEGFEERRWARNSLQNSLESRD